MVRSVCVAAGALVVVAVGAPGPARADVKTECVAASEAGQRLRFDAKLLAARERFAACARTACPLIVRQDCTQWSGELAQAIPTIVLAARDARGADLVDVRVSMDGRALAASLDGRALEVDPGVHRFRFEARGRQAVETRVLVRTGEKARSVMATLRAPAPPAREGVPESDHSPPLFGYVLGGVGVVALAGAAALDLDATSSAHDLRATCAPGCAQSDVDAIHTRYALAAVSLGVGVVSIGLAAFLLLSPAPEPAQGWTFDVRPTTGGATGGFGARF